MGCATAPSFVFIASKPATGRNISTLIPGIAAMICTSMLYPSNQIEPTPLHHYNVSRKHHIEHNENIECSRNEKAANQRGYFYRIPAYLWIGMRFYSFRVERSGEYTLLRALTEVLGYSIILV